MEHPKSIAPGTVLGGGSLVCLVVYFILQISRHAINSPYSDIPPRFNIPEALIDGLLVFSVLFGALGLGVETVRRIYASWDQMEFTGNLGLPLIALFLAVFGFLCGPDLLYPRYKSSANACINNLRQIDAAKQTWGLEHQKPPEAIPTEADLLPYLGRTIPPATNMLPKCPAGGVYHFNPLSQPPTCSISTNLFPNHILPIGITN